MEFVDKAFARRLEATEEVPQVHHARLYQKLYPEVNAAAEEICGGHMVFAGVGSPIGRAVGLGLDGPVSSANLDRLEQFYRSRGAAAQVDVCPLTDSTLIEMLKKRCYSMTELNNVLYRRLQPNEPIPEIPEGINIRPTDSGQAGVTQGGSTSQRNYERMGFRVAYSKATLFKTFE